MQRRWFEGLLVMAMVVSLFGGGGVVACTGGCPGDCDRRFDDCVERSRSPDDRAQCSMAHSECRRSCDSRGE